MKKRETSILPLLSCMALFLSFYPLIALYTAFDPACSVFACLLQLAEVVLFGFVGFLVGKVLERKGYSPLWRRILGCGCALTAGFVAFFTAGIACGLSSRFGVLLLASVACILGEEAVFQPYQKIFHLFLFSLELFLAAAVALLTAWLELPYQAEVQVWVLLAVVALYAILKNQWGFERQVRGSGNKTHLLPVGIRKQNLYWMIGFLLFLVLLFATRGWLVWLLEHTVPSLPKHEALPVAPSQSESWLPELDPSTIQASQAALALQIVFQYMIPATALYLLVCYHRKLTEKMKRLWESLKGFLHRLFFREKRASKIRQNVYYSDEVEFMKAEKSEKRRKQGIMTKRGWRKQYETFRRGGGGYREGYRLALLWFALKKKAPAPYQTPLEIYRATSSMIEEKGYLEATEGYDTVRYGEKEESDGQYQSLLRTLAWMYREL